MKKRLFRLGALCCAAAMTITTSAQALSVEEAYDILQRSYVDKLPRAAQDAKSLDELFSYTDDYTCYMTAEEYQAFLQGVEGDVSFAGIGAEITYVPEGIRIVSVLKGGGAEKAGLAAGDIIIAIESESCAPGGAEHRAKLLGEAGTSVTVTVRHADGTQADYTVTRALVTQTNTTVSVTGGVGYIDCDSFGTQTGTYFQEGVRGNDSAVRAWIVDLRGNGGGLTSAAVSALGAFSGEGDLIYFVDQDGESTAQSYSGKDLTDKPAIVLMDSGSASASEIFAGGVLGTGSGIVIGTHKLLSESVRFKRLGLVVIDEEHRFGVRQKERLKSLRAEVDVLTLTATPIPRTLAMSLEGIRDFSVIATAPQKRLAIKTFVRRESKALIREAVIRELKRGGQVYFLHNDVDTIQARAEMLAELIPEARIGIAHGQMSERELERVMREFYRREFNVLVCTTIIETGIDIPIANTIIMHRADKFGLAQLHQLRGRVGRSHHQAYAYLLIPDEGAITKNAERRLEAIQNLEELGSGFYLSMHDLEIRGAGEVLGDEQSGEMAQVGFELYTQMLKRAVDSLRRGEEPTFDSPFETLTEINLHLPALLPDDYVPDVGTRLSLYKRLAAAQTLEELGECTDDLTDRFGSPVPAAKTLLAVHRLRIECAAIGIRKIDAAEQAIVFTFAQKTMFDPAVMFALLQKRRDLRVLPGSLTRLKMTVNSENAVTRLQNVRTIVNALLESLPPEKRP